MKRFHFKVIKSALSNYVNLDGMERFVLVHLQKDKQIILTYRIGSTSH